MQGATLAVDFRNRGDRTLALMSRLDAIVAAAGGRLYAAKDGRIPRADVEAGYPDLERFAAQVDRLLQLGLLAACHGRSGGVKRPPLSR